ncbi:ethanolamine ammonia-lyase subunit EutC [Rhodococcus ruber]|uniref:ethanolamine ammonia-lyase subunit EutC n=1 Tax=Rhodococcus ruber TaxID=1830 RepID=UPI0007CD6FA6|nr:ethanolamine ammonia-lyase subunit EutC [Rhodococcus ruber]AWH01473.1 ethanolamine ammonia-lyase subunit EutC [Rhodococcus ruber]QRE79096.1 ethanolamine ammonia-lyase subunit EutC [Rhodococcus ruber]
MNDDFWTPLRALTRARIGLGRNGNGLPTPRLLEVAEAHARARDAVHAPLDLAELNPQISAVGIGEPIHVASRARDRSVYLRRPDLGRTPADLSPVPHTDADIGVVLCDGLSSTALAAHGPGLLAELATALTPGLTFAPPVVATQARVAIGDHVGAALGVSTVVVLIGERPGLSVADSLGVYLTHRPRPGRTDAERNCVSNIHPPDGLDLAHAARVVASLVQGARRLGRSGVQLKDTSRETALE